MITLNDLIWWCFDKPFQEYPYRKGGSDSFDERRYNKVDDYVSQYYYDMHDKFPNQIWIIDHDDNT
jgi:hypothetical protein